MPRPNSGCKNCKNRHLGCHSTCESYRAFKEELDKLNQKIQAENALGTARPYNKYALKWGAK